MSDGVADEIRVETQEVFTDENGRHSRGPIVAVLVTEDPDEAIGEWERLLYLSDDHVDVRLIARGLPKKVEPDVSDT